MGQSNSQALALLALARHAELTGDRTWTQRALTAMVRGAEALAQDEGAPEQWRAAAFAALRRVVDSMALDASVPEGPEETPLDWNEADAGWQLPRLRGRCRPVRPGPPARPPIGAGSMVPARARGTDEGPPGLLGWADDLSGGQPYAVRDRSGACGLMRFPFSS